MKKRSWAVALLSAGLVVLFGPGSVGRADDNDDRKGAGQSDHALFCTCSVPADTAIYCGVRRGAEPYTLHVSGTAAASPGTFSITFQDGDPMGFSVPADSTHSTTHTLGGVPGVDNLVRITGTGGVGSMMASVQARSGARDPFGGDDERDNFCVTINASGFDNNGLTITTTLSVPNDWVVDGDGSNGGTLK
jgi:hypothetical protein